MEGTEQGKALIVSLHDAHPGSQVKIKEQIEFLAEHGVTRSSILVVPSFHHQGSVVNFPNFSEAVQDWQVKGHEIVLHGYFHDRVASPPENLKSLFWTRLYTNKEAEFFDLPMTDARERIQWGLDIFKGLDWKTCGFVAPAWLMPEKLEPVLAEMGFRYTTRLRKIIALSGAGSSKAGRTIQSQSLCYSTRSSWRIVASALWCKRLFKRLRKTNLVRLSLHPNDLNFALTRRQIGQILMACQKSQFIPTTYADYVAR